MEYERIYRHGDVLLYKLNEKKSKEARAKAVREKTRKLTLAYGEVTGHAHRLSGDVEVLEWEGGPDEILFRVSSGATLTHEEHDRMILEEGLYLKVNQVEFDPLEEVIREIAD